MYLFKRLIQNLTDMGSPHRKKGWGARFSRIGDLFLRIFYAKAEYYIMAHNLNLPPMDPRQIADSDLNIRQVEDHKDIEQLEPLTSKGLSNFIPDPINWLKKIFDDGGIGYIAFYRDQVIGCSWISFRVTRQLMRVPVPLAPGDAYIHSLFVSADKRSLKYGRILSMRQLQYLRENGYKRGIIIVIKDNAPALKVDKVVGYQHIGEVIHTRILFRDFYKYPTRQGRNQIEN